MIYFEIFLTFLIIGTFTFGGGYAMLSLIQDEVVRKHEWISIEQFTDIVAISQTTPGPIGINSATYIGYTATHNMGYSEVASIGGSVLATIAVMIPSFVIVLAICKVFSILKDNIYFKSLIVSLRPIIIGMIAAAAGLLMNSQNFIHWSSVLIFVATFVACFWLKINPIVAIVTCGIVGLIIY